jgi:hypothetical protein
MARAHRHDPGLIRLGSRFDDAHLVPTPEYYAQLLSLRSVDWLRVSLLEGCISAAGAGSESLMRSSRLALADYVGGSSASALGRLSADLLTIIRTRVADDRVIIPALAVVAFLFDSAGSESLVHDRFS